MAPRRAKPEPAVTFDHATHTVTIGAEMVAIPVGTTVPEVVVTVPGRAPVKFPVVDEWIHVPADHPLLAHLLRHFAPSENSGNPALTATDMGQEPGPTETPETPAEPQE